MKIDIGKRYALQNEGQNSLLFGITLGPLLLFLLLLTDMSHKLFMLLLPVPFVLSFIFLISPFMRLFGILLSIRILKRHSSAIPDSQCMECGGTVDAEPLLVWYGIITDRHDYQTGNVFHWNTQYHLKGQILAFICDKCKKRILASRIRGMIRLSALIDIPLLFALYAIGAKNVLDSVSWVAIIMVLGVPFFVSWVAYLTRNRVDVFEKYVWMRQRWGIYRAYLEDSDLIEYWTPATYAKLTNEPIKRRD